MSAMTCVSSTATNFSFFFATGLVVTGSGAVPNNFCQKLRTCFASETISSTVFLTSMKDVLASLYSLHPCLMAATQALAAKRSEIGSISRSYTNQVTTEYRVPDVTGKISCGYMKLDGNKMADPFGTLIVNSRSKNANSPPS